MNAATTWISRKVSRLSPLDPKAEAAEGGGSGAATKPAKAAVLLVADSEVWRTKSATFALDLALLGDLVLTKLGELGMSAGALPTELMPEKSAVLTEPWILSSRSSGSIQFSGYRKTFRLASHTR